jgi:hypothetical protein
MLKHHFIESLQKDKEEFIKKYITFIQLNQIHLKNYVLNKNVKGLLHYNKIVRIRNVLSVKYNFVQAVFYKLIKDHAGIIK